MNTATRRLQPRIYVACLAAYNNGKLHGAWIDANQSPEDLQTEIDEMLAASPEPHAEEWAVHYTENMPDIGEYPSLKDVSRIAEHIEADGEIALAIFGREDIENAIRILEDHEYDITTSLADYAMEYADNMGFKVDDIPDYIQWSIDWNEAGEHLTRDNVTERLSDGSILILH